jgi:hypothetical protein
VRSPGSECVVGADGEVGYRVGRELFDEFLVFVAGRARPNTVKAYAHDLKVFLAIVGKKPVEVTARDVFGFVTEQRRGRAGAENVVRITDGRPVCRRRRSSGVSPHATGRDRLHRTSPGGFETLAVARCRDLMTYVRRSLDRAATSTFRVLVSIVGEVPDHEGLPRSPYSPLTWTYTDDEARPPPTGSEVEDRRRIRPAFASGDVGVGVGPERPACLSAGGFLRPALRTGRATSTASGSPRVMPLWRVVLWSRSSMGSGSWCPGSGIAR